MMRWRTRESKLCYAVVDSNVKIIYIRCQVTHKEIDITDVMSSTHPKKLYGGIHSHRNPRRRFMFDLSKVINYGYMNFFGAGVSAER